MMLLKTTCWLFSSHLLAYVVEETYLGIKLVTGTAIKNGCYRRTVKQIKTMTLSYLFFSMLLGMRHGLDPDHLAIINGVNLNEHSKNKSNIWSGLFFSLGHGVTVTIIGVLIISLNESLKPYTRILEFTEWIPIVLLLFTGFYGLYSIYNGLVHRINNHTHKKWSSILSKNKYSSIKLFFTGIFFALVFDTSTQVVAWGLAGEGINNANQYWAAIFIGLFFTAGMIATDTLNGLFFYQILHAQHSKFDIKIFISLLVVLTSLTLGSIQLFEKLGLAIEISDSYKLLWGMLIMVASITGLLINFLQPKKQKS